MPPATDTVLENARRDRARLILIRVKGIDETGGADNVVRELRFLAAAVLELLSSLNAERSARRALQARCETLQEIVGEAAYDACGQPESGVEWPDA